MTFSFLGIDHVQLAAPSGCEAEARRFYTELLGWTEVPKPEALRARGGIWFRCGRHEVHIGVQADFTPARKAHPAFEVARLVSLRDHLLRNGVAVMDDDARAEEGVERCYVDDPFGNRLEFLERPATTMA